MRISGLRYTVASREWKHETFRPVRLVCCNLVGRGVTSWYTTFLNTLGVIHMCIVGFDFKYGEVSLDETHIQNLTLLGLSLLYLSGEL